MRLLVYLVVSFRQQNRAAVPARVERNWKSGPDSRRETTDSLHKPRERKEGIAVLVGTVKLPCPWLPKNYSVLAPQRASDRKAIPI